MSTTKDKIKDRFLSGQTLTSCEAAKEFITADLRKIISDLRKEGMDIVGEWVTSAEKKRYKEYWLRTEVPATAPVIPPPPTMEIKSTQPEIRHTPFVNPQLQFRL